MPLPDISRVFNRVDRDLWIVTAAQGNVRSGLVATLVVQASIVPELPRVLVGLSQQHLTGELVATSGTFALHLISETHADWVAHFGLQTGRNTDKFAGFRTTVGQTGSPILSDSLGWLECRVESKLPIGDRTLYLAEVLDGSVQSEAAPLTLKRWFELASPAQIAQLKSQMREDLQVDAPAIANWRDAAARK